MQKIYIFQFDQMCQKQKYECIAKGKFERSRIVTYLDKAF